MKNGLSPLTNLWTKTMTDIFLIAHQQHAQKWAGIQRLELMYTSMCTWCPFTQAFNVWLMCEQQQGKNTNISLQMGCLLAKTMWHCIHY